MIFLILVWLVLSQSSFSAPLPSSQREYVSWKSEPATRGTFRLLASCIITLTLCAWTAVHLNIAVEELPHEQWSLARRIRCTNAFRKAKWIVIGLAPELVVYTTWRQLSSVHEMMQRMRELFDEEGGLSNSPLRKYAC